MRRGPDVEFASQGRGARGRSHPAGVLAGIVGVVALLVVPLSPAGAATAISTSTDALASAGLPGAPNGPRTPVATGLSSPQGVAVDSSGNVYISEYSGHTVLEVAPNGTQRTVTDQYNCPDNVAVDSTGNVYLADNCDQVIVEVPTSGPAAVVVNGAGFPFGLALDLTGNLYWSSAQANVVTENNSATIGSGFSAPAGLALDSTGNLYVADSGNDRVEKVALSGGTQTTIASGLTGLRGLAVNAASTVFVSEPASDLVTKITQNGTKTTFASGFSSPEGVAVDEAGTVYVADSGNNSVVKIGSRPVATSTASNSATVTWSPPGTDGGSTITSYTATARDTTTSANGGQTCTYTVANPETDSCVVTGLMNGDKYTFTVTATNGNGTGPASLASKAVVPKAVVSCTSITPGTLAQGASAVPVTITGTGFVAGSTAKVSGTGVKLSFVTVVDATTITANARVASAAAIGARNINVLTPAGKATCAGCLNVVTGPTLTKIAPSSAARGTTTSVTLTGTAFAAGATVKGPKGVRFSNVTVVSPTSITATMRVAGTAPTGTNLAVTVTNDSANYYGKATGDALTVT